MTGEERAVTYWPRGQVFISEKWYARTMVRSPGKAENIKVETLAQYLVWTRKQRNLAS